MTICKVRGRTRCCTESLPRRTSTGSSIHAITTSVVDILHMILLAGRFCRQGLFGHLCKGMHIFGAKHVCWVPQLILMGITSQDLRSKTQESREAPEGQKGATDTRRGKGSEEQEVGTRSGVRIEGIRTGLGTRKQLGAMVWIFVKGLTGVIYCGFLVITTCNM